MNALILLLACAPSTTMPADYSIDSNEKTLVAKDADGKQLWTWTSPERLRKVPGGVLDFDGDGTTEVFVATNEKDAAGKLVALDHAGSVLWQWETPALSTTVDGKKVPVLSRVEPDKIAFWTKGPRLIAVATACDFGASVVVVLDPAKKELGRFFHHGAIGQVRFADTDQDGRPEVWVWGSANAFKTQEQQDKWSSVYPYFVAALDPTRLQGESPTPTSAKAPAGCLLYSVFPLSPLTVDLADGLYNQQGKCIKNREAGFAESKDGKSCFFQHPDGRDFAVTPSGLTLVARGQFFDAAMKKQANDKKQELERFLKNGHLTFLEPKK